ncbi:hypothetical protein FACS1894109_15620 [Spirochaetia bacterium]|nr:hypothetical protein FACS1894109_15620 [Spirochaetia bacterium]
MLAEKVIAVLTAGLKAAHCRMFRPESLRREDYPHNLNKLYGYLEDELYATYSGITGKDWQKVYDHSGDIIVRASMIADMAEDVLKGKNGEVANN